MMALTAFLAGGGGLAWAHPLVDEIEESCTALVTVQKGMCEVDRIFRCDALGYVTIGANEGVVEGVEFSSPEGNLGDFIALDGRGSVTLQQTEDPMDLNILRAEGSDRSRYTAILDIGSPAEMTIDLSVVLSGEILTRNGVRFRAGSAGMEMTTSSPIGGFTRVWDILVAEDENFVVTGRSTMVTDDGTEEFETGIRDILVPGDAGFASHQGRYDCGEEL